MPEMNGAVEREQAAGESNERGGGVHTREVDAVVRSAETKGVQGK